MQMRLAMATLRPWIEGEFFKVELILAQFGTVYHKLQEFNVQLK